MINKRRRISREQLSAIKNGTYCLKTSVKEKKNLRNRTKNGSGCDVNYNLIYWHLAFLIKSRHLKGIERKKTTIHNPATIKRAFTAFHETTAPDEQVFIFIAQLLPFFRKFPPTHVAVACKV